MDNIKKDKRDVMEYEEYIKEMKNQTDNNCFYFEDNNLVVTDKELNIQLKEMNDDLVIVHSTDYFPNNKTIYNSYEGYKKDKSKKRVIYNIDTVYKEIDVIPHRRTVHFVVNDAVESTSKGEGIWNDKKYIVIDNLEKYKDKFVGTNESDSYTNESLHLTGKPLLLVRKDCYKEIPKEELDNWNIILYEGDFKKCVRNVLKSLGYKIHPQYKDAPAHTGSSYNVAETILEKRNMFLSYISNNQYDGYSEYESNLSECYEYYKKSSKTGVQESEISLYVSEKLNIPKEFVKFIICYGIRKGNYDYKNIIFKNDDELYNELVDLQNAKLVTTNQMESSEYIQKNMGIIKDLYEIYLKTQKEKDYIKKYDSDALKYRCVYDLYKIENINYAKTFSDEYKNTNPDNGNIVYFPGGIKKMGISKEGVKTEKEIYGYSSLNSSENAKEALNKLTEKEKMLNEMFDEKLENEIYNEITKSI